VVDSDIWAYSIGFAAQRTLYDAVVSDADGEFVERGIFDSKDEPMAIAAAIGGEVDFASVVEPSPLRHALHMCKLVLLRLEDDLDKAGIDFRRMELYLTGKGNYREKLATIRPYKGNRLKLEKPVHYKAIRRYLMERWGAQVVEGFEADDMVAMIAAAEDYDPQRVVIVSADKDLRTVPGLHYNQGKRTFETITEQQALVAEYRQILSGDTTDNIVGCYKTGAKRAEKIIDAAMDERGMWGAAALEFAISLSRHGCPYADKTPFEALLETYRLVHMARGMDETRLDWVPGVVR